MKTRRLRLVRPKWTLGTMLLIVGWSAVVVWLNVRPQVTYYTHWTRYPLDEDDWAEVSCGFPWNYWCAWSHRPYANHPHWSLTPVCGTRIGLGV